MNKSELTNYILDINSDFSECLIKLQRNKHKNLFVTKNNKYYGSISDGDIRRSLIKNKSLSLNNIINKKSYYLKHGSKQNIKIPDYLKLIPIVDKLYRIIDIKINKQDKKNFNFDAIIMAGGKGTRLKPFTLKKPKAMIKFQGKELIFHIIKKINKSNPQKIYISTKYRHDQIEKFVNKNFNSKIKCIKETKKLGTFGALSLLKKENVSENIIIFNCDVITNLKIDNLINFHQKNNSDITICATKKKLSIPYGIIGNEIGHKNDLIIEKPDFHFWANSGIYVMKKNILNYFMFKKKIDSVAFINRLHKLKKKISYFPLYEKWIDMGTFKNIIKANKIFKKYVQ